ncbi:hypothetical protein BCR34DRAFT_582356 [Clohesyomyces aquaticus]|uniref:Uncharacterized protein n=1 Tax=Clohesyomyces aquaticus TaxID=1231657 RepID=A0A1Y2AA20_9PLEO|nr:hypothetical protein BCR34DRAFT_582356 [Clohesyomyces aquaticus]
MMPGAGLFLRDSLYPKEPPTMEPAEVRSVRRKSTERTSFERGGVERKSKQDSSGAFSSISTVFKFADFVAALNGVPSETDIFVNLIQRVRQDVNEALRLHASSNVADFFETFPHKKVWIDSILLDVQRALNDIGVYVEDVREGGDEGGAARMKHRFEWVLTHHQKLISREIALNTCHQSLMAAIQAMQASEMGAHYAASSSAVELPVPQPPTLPWLQEEDILRGPYSRQKWRMSQKNLSLPSITVSEFGSEPSLADSVNSSPVELPGSTPDDLPDPDNWDLYASPQDSRRSLDQPSNRTFSIARKPIRCEKVPPPLPNTLGTLKLARRYRPKAVDVRRPMPKHNSLPTKLPYLPRQPSLYMELSQYVMPSSEQEIDESIPKPQYVDTLATSVDSSPDGSTSATSCPEEFLTKELRINSAPIVLSSEQHVPSNVGSIGKGDGVTDPRGDSIKQEHEPLPREADSNAREKLPNMDEVRNEPQEIVPVEDIANEPRVSETNPVSEELYTKPGSPPERLRQISEAVLERQEKPNSSLRDSKFPETTSPSENKPVGDVSLAAATPAPLPPAQPTQPAQPVQPALTAQAKRRRAQARRMQMAYGSD